MKKLFSWVTLCLASLFTITAQAQEPSVEEVRAVIFGDWQVMSFQREGGELIDYSKDNVVWSFDESYRASIQGGGFEAIESGYKVIPSRWGWRGITGVFIVVYGLKDGMNDYSAHPKLIAKSLSDSGEMRIVNWEDDVTYILQKRN